MISKTRISTRHLVALFALALLALPGSAGAEVPKGFHLDYVGFEAVSDPATAFFESEQLAAEFAAQEGKVLPGKVFSLEHHVPIGDGRTLYVTEYFTMKAWQRWPRRAVLMLGAPVTRGSYWSIPVDGYNATAMVAQRGSFAFTVDYIGVGKSYRPENGRDITFEQSVDALRHVLRYIRFFRAVPKVDIIAESLGGAMATQLASDADRVRRVTISTVLYKTLVDQRIAAPEWFAFLDSLPDGYLPSPPESYEKFLANSPNEALRKYTYASQPGLYPAAPFKWIAQLPYFDPSIARVPALIVVGKSDFVPGPDDPRQLAADYGETGAKLVVFEEAGHVPRIENEVNAARYWEEVFRFIEP